MKSLLVSDIFFVISIVTGVILWAIALYVKNNQPQKPNRSYGYRTSRSMRTQEAWDFSQEYSINLLIKSAQFLCLLAVLSLFIELNKELSGYLATIVILLVVLFPVYKTERELKKRFGT